MSANIILIGPIGAGKSTQAGLLAKKLGLPRCSMDDVRFAYYKEIGYDEAEQKRIEGESGFLGVYRYWKPFEIHAVERLTAEYQGHVIDFGGGHSVYEDPALLARAEKALAPHRNVVLLLPSPDPDESVRVLKARSQAHVGWDGINGDLDFHEHFVKHPSNRALAKQVVYTLGKSADETCDEIIAALAETPAPPAAGNF